MRKHSRKTSMKELLKFDAGSQGGSFFIDRMIGFAGLIAGAVVGYFLGELVQWLL